MTEAEPQAKLLPASAVGDLPMMNPSADLPTPLALVHERLRLVPEQSAQERFDAAQYLVEASIKFVTCTGLSILRAQVPDTAQGFAHGLARADSIGIWVSSLALMAQKLHRLPVESARQFARAVTRKEDPERAGSTTDLAQMVASLECVVAALEEPDYGGSTRRRHNLIDIMGDMVFVRNRTRGHGAKTWRFYEVAAEPMATAARIMASLIPSTSRWALAAAAKMPDDKRLDVLFLQGLQPRERGHLQTSVTAERGSVVVVSGDSVASLEPLAEVLPDTFETLFANGAWRTDSAVGQFIDYRSGKTQHLHRPLYAGRLPELPPSEIAAQAQLTFDANCAHNLPRMLEGYVSRPNLEANLRKLLCDKVHRLITLRGPGGSGKTWLALRTIHDLTSAGSEFDAVIWFSARDIDLLESGPAPRRREVTDLDGIIRMFEMLLGADGSDDERALEFFKSSVDGSQPGAVSYLLVVDNFETFDFPAAVHQFLDETVVLPSKVLITSRHTTFQGDFPVVVRGMEDDEAQALLTYEARRHYCEPRLTSDARRRIIDATGASPYAMKLAIANFAAGEAVQSLVNSIRKREDVLAALFDRSYEHLSDDGKFLYLLLGAIGRPALETPLRAALLLANRDFQDALDELTQYSLGNRETDALDNEILSLVQMASFHAQRLLIGHEDQLLIEDRARSFRRWSQARPGRSPLGIFFQNLFDEALRLRAGDEAWEEIISIAEHCAESHPDLWPSVARALDVAQADPERVRAALRRATEAAPLDAARWLSWAAFERRVGDQRQFLYKSIRALEIDSSNPQHCSDVAAELADYITTHKEEIPPERRDMLLGSVRFALAGHRKNRSLHANDLSRLGWLYLLEYSPLANPDAALIHSAKECAEEGLQLDPDNVYCRSLLARTKRSL